MSRPASTLVLLIVLAVAGQRTLSHVAREEKDDWRGAVAALDDMAGPDETVLVIVPEHVVYRPYYGRVSRPDAVVVHLPKSGPPRRAVDLLPLGGHERVWGLWSFHRWGEEQDAVVGALEHAGLPVTGSWSFRRLRVTRHERVPELGTGRQPAHPEADPGG